MAIMLEDKRTGGLIVGIELAEKHAQVSYYRPGAPDIDTLSAIEGAEVFDFPLILARRGDNGQWLIGRDAAQAYARGEADIVNDVFNLAVAGESVRVGGESYQGGGLLALYVKKLLGLVVTEVAGAGVGLEMISGLQFTVDDPEGTASNMLATLAEDMRKSLTAVKRIESCTNAESFFNFMTDQPEEMKGHEVFGLLLKDDRLISYIHEINHYTRPFVAGVVRADEKPVLSEWSNEKKDEEFLKIITEKMSGHIVSTVFLLGEGFSEDWLKRSLDYLCQGKRVFLGNNLFSRGAVVRMRNLLEPKEDGGAEVVFLGPDKIMANVGIRIRKLGNVHYHALIDAGTSWYNAGASLDLILDKDPFIALEITPLAGGGMRTEVLELTGLPRRERRATRVSVSLTMFSVDKVKLSVTDLGFGDMYPSSGEHWEKFIGLTSAGSGKPRALSEGIITEPILCMGRMAKKSFRFEFLEDRVRSVEELCHFIAKNDYLLTMDNFSGDLPEWLDRECGLTPLAAELRELQRRKCSITAYVGTIMDYTRFYPRDEVQRIADNLKSGDAKNGTEKKLKIIEYLIKEGRLSEAHAMIRAFDTTDKNPVVKARLCYDEGAIYARLFHYGAAAYCMNKAYELSGDSQVKEAYLAALRLSMGEEEYIDAIGNRPELSPESLTLETRLSETLDLFAAGPDNHLVNTLKVYLDTGNLRQFDEETAGAEENALATYRRAIG